MLLVYEKKPQKGIQKVFKKTVSKKENVLKCTTDISKFKITLKFDGGVY